LGGVADLKFQSARRRWRSIRLPASGDKQFVEMAQDLAAFAKKTALSRKLVLHACVASGGGARHPIGEGETRLLNNHLQSCASTQSVAARPSRSAWAD